MTAIDALQNLELALAHQLAASVREVADTKARATVAVAESVPAAIMFGRINDHAMAVGKHAGILAAMALLSLHIEQAGKPVQAAS